MKNEQILIKLHLSPTDSFLPPVFFSLIESVFPKNMGTGILKRYVFQDNGYDTEHTLFLTSFSRFKHLLHSNDFLDENDFFFYVQKNSSYFDCLKIKQFFSISIVLPKESFVKHHKLFSLLPQTLWNDLYDFTESQFDFNQNLEVLSIFNTSLQNYFELQKKYFLERLSLEEVLQKISLTHDYLKKGTELFGI